MLSNGDDDGEQARPVREPEQVVAPLARRVIRILGQLPNHSVSHEWSFFSLWARIDARNVAPQTPYMRFPTTRPRQRRVIHSGVTLTAIAGIVALSACSDLTGIDAPGTRDFRGRYTSGFEASSFVPCEKPEGTVGWWTGFELAQQSASLDSALRAHRDPQDFFARPHSTWRYALD